MSWPSIPLVFDGLKAFLPRFYVGASMTLTAAISAFIAYKVGRVRGLNAAPSALRSALTQTRSELIQCEARLEAEVRVTAALRAVIEQLTDAIKERASIGGVAVRADPSVPRGEARIVNLRVPK